MSEQACSKQVDQHRSAVAKLISVVLQPMTVATILYVMVSWHVATGREAALFFLVGFSFVALGPAVLMLLLKRWQVISDLDISNRRERFVPYLMIVGLNSISLLIYWMMGAQKPLLGISLSYMAVTLVGGFISIYWKISMHLAGISGPVTALVMIIHPLLSLLYLVCVPVGWARLFLKKHTLSQIVLGSFFSAILTLMVISLVK